MFDRAPHRPYFRLSAFAFVLAAAACSGGGGNGVQAGDGGTSGGGLAATVNGVDVPSDKGTVHGTTSKGVRAFLGVPYAAPPTGSNRWKPPQPVAAWTGTRDATQLGADCAQGILPGSVAYASNSKEDCLTLNVWSPDPAPAPGTHLPVMVWIYGGAYQFGSGGGPYTGENLVEKGNVVVVTMNYRLGPLGFLAHAALAGEDPDHVTGNYGIMDQRAALQWVQANIAQFGGDPSAVTLFGESAGGNSTCIHLLSPASRGLFQRAIVESGLCMKPARTLDDAEAQGDRFAKALGCTDAANVLGCLRAQPPNGLVSTANDITSSPGGLFYEDAATSFFFQPIVDGHLLPEQPATAFDRGDFAKVPVLHGNNGAEGVLFESAVLGGSGVSNATEYQTALATRFGARAVDVIARYPAASYASATDALAEATGDAFFVCPARRMARDLSKAGVTNYLYLFTGTTTGGIVPSLDGIPFHSAEIPYVFGNSFPLGSVPPSGAALQTAIQGYWLSFARAGNPNALDADASSLSWPAFDVQADTRIALAPSPALVSNFKSALCDFWDGVDITAP